jgi:hypothetical protein
MRPLEQEWGDFRDRHAAWLARLAPADEFHALPEAAIDALGSGGLTGSPVLDRSSARAERELAALCRRLGVVGLRDGEAIIYPYLAAALPAPTDEAMEAMGWTPAQRGSARHLVGLGEATRSRLKGVAGWLVVEPDFLGSARELEARWSALPAGERPGFPLRRAAVIPAAPPGARPVADAARDFVTAFGDFCDRWELVGLASWGLPEPLGPLLPAPGPAAIPALGGRGLCLSLPLHYPLAGDDDLLVEVFREQRRLAAERGLDRSLAGLPHHRAYGQILEVVHLERSVQERYGRPGRSRGLVTRLEAAMAAALGVTIAQVQKLRKAASSCRRGHRARVAWLSPRAR